MITFNHVVIVRTIARNLQELLLAQQLYIYIAMCPKQFSISVTGNFVLRISVCIKSYMSHACLIDCIKFEVRLNSTHHTIPLAHFPIKNVNLSKIKSSLGVLILQISVMSSGRVLMDTRLTIILLSGRRCEIVEQTLSQNVDAMLVVGENCAMLWQPERGYTQVIYGSAFCVCFENSFKMYTMETLRSALQDIMINTMTIYHFNEST